MGDHRFDFGFLGDIDSPKVCLSSGIANAPKRLLTGLLVQVTDQNPGALLSEELGGLLANSTSRARHQGDFAVNHSCHEVAPLG
jgi:hypothetical protein